MNPLPFQPSAGAKRGGGECQYELKNKQLYIAGIYYRLGEDCKRVGGRILPTDFFGDEAVYPVKAAWFNGELNFGERVGKVGNMRKLPKSHSLTFKEGTLVK